VGLTSLFGGTGGGASAFVAFAKRSDKPIPKGPKQHRAKETRRNQARCPNR
jgi:hypothetical protein